MGRDHGDNERQRWPAGTGSPNGSGLASARRTELAAFLRTRRERILPEDVGLPPGTRRRTAGLRREELAQLAGVGVTWYTWLEQGRKINASVQVLDAIATTLRLDATERAHLFRLADVPGAAAPADCPDCPLPPTVQQIVDVIPLPAAVLTERFDLLAWNQVYASIFPALTSSPPGERNTLLANLAEPACCGPVEDPDQHCDVLVAQLRAAYGRHVGDPAWTHFIRRLEALSPTFAAAWAAHDVAKPTALHQEVPPPGRRPDHHHHDQLRGQRGPRRPPGGLHARRRAEREGPGPAGRGRPAGRPLPLLVRPPSAAVRACSAPAETPRLRHRAS